LVPVGRRKKKNLNILQYHDCMELLVVLMGVRASKFIVKELGLEITEDCIFDSQCVLYWLKTNKPLSLFIKNCVKEIITEMDIIFQYNESAQNPADIATRGSSVSGINQSDLWWSDPAWLKNEDSL